MPRVHLLSNPRSGSCYLHDLLNCHPEIEIADDELLDDQNGRLENPLELVQQSLAALKSTFVGFKVFPEQVYFQGLDFGELLQATGTTHVIVLWREGILEALTSRRIAVQTKEWYSLNKNERTQRVTICPKDLTTYINKLNSDWEKIGIQWPVGVRPIFVKFEDLISQPMEEIKRILTEIGLTFDNVDFVATSERQNPAKIEDKVINFHELPPEHRDAKLNVEKILRDKFILSI